jgi:hypothetical protein
VISHRAVRRLRWAVLLAGLVPVALLACRLGSASEGFVEGPECPGPTCISDLKDLCLEQLQGLYATGTSGCTPAGCSRGEVLVMADTRHPRMKVRMANTVWKGKCFAEDGSFINQWAGFRALHSCVAEGPSWFDGQPCIVMEYPPGTPLFANLRDELRQIGPCLWLGMFYDREPCPKFRGMFALESAPDKHSRCRH